MSTSLRVLATVVVTVLALGGCGSAAATADLTLAELTVDQVRFDERTVRTDGVVRTAPSPRHYWIEDADLNRVELQPHDQVEDLVGWTVQVEGHFTFRDDEGRRIQIEELTVLGGTS